ncbi:MAG: acyl-CoA thioesterase [Thermoplasmata archaeon]|nr:acyl-CoA thioesterase [Thermoplasmata archaeon]
MTPPSTPPPPPLSSTPPHPTLPWPHSRRFRIQYAELDVLNHLNHAVYFRFMETLRCEYYLGLRRSIDPHDLDIIIAEARCRYLAPVTYAAELVGEVAPAHPLGRTSFSLVYRFSNERERVVTARGHTAIVAYDYLKGSKKPIPELVRAALDRDAVNAQDEGW